MNSLSKKLKLISSIIVGIISTTVTSTTSAQAADFSFRGTFDNDDDVQLFDFTVEQTSNVTLKTLSYAGGIQADTTIIPPGGFDPILALFDGDGNFIDNNDDGILPDVESDPVTDQTFDTFLQKELTPGNYTVAVSQYDNFFNGELGDPIALGFYEEGDPNFTASFGRCSNNQFCDLTGDNRTNQWAFDVINVETAVTEPPVTENVPEPSTIFGSLVILGLMTNLKKYSQK